MPTRSSGEVRDAGLLARGGAVLVLLSGGRDSTCLLDLAVRIAGASVRPRAPRQLPAARAADGDERHCEELCERLGVPLEVRHPAAPDTGNLQAWARAQRYGAAAELALADGGDVAAGHTSTDQVETILYRLASSPSRRALLGMRPRDGALSGRCCHIHAGETAAYCLERGLRGARMRRNELSIYARGRIRGRLVPALREIHPAAEANVLALAEILRDEADVLDAAVDGALGGRARSS